MTNIHNFIPVTCSVYSMAHGLFITHGSNIHHVLYLIDKTYQHTSQTIYSISMKFYKLTLTGHYYLTE